MDKTEYHRSGKVLCWTRGTKINKKNAANMTRPLKKRPKLKTITYL